MRMLPGPSRPSAGRLGWWIVGCFLALVAAFWLTERAVDWLWMGTLGYRSVFWQIIDLRFALFAAAFFPLALVLLAQPALGHAVDGGLAPGDRRPDRPGTRPARTVGPAAPGAAGAARVHRRDLVRRDLGRRGPLPLRRALRARGPVARPRRGFLRVSAAADRSGLAWGLLRRARHAARPSGARDRARRVPRLDAARRRDARSDSVCARLEPRRGRACFLRRLHPRSLQPALRLERHRLGPGLCERARGDAGAMADGSDRVRGGGAGSGSRAAPRPAADGLGHRRRGRRAPRPAGHPPGGDPGGLCRSERA